MDIDINLCPPGMRLARGIARHLRGHDVMTVAEFVPAPGLRVDLIGVGPKGDIWIVECKSCQADYAADRKWHRYLEWCDRFFWGVDADFPQTLLPGGSGLILADPYDAEIMRMGPETRLAPARRKALTLAIARTAAARLQAARDPGVPNRF